MIHYKFQVTWTFLSVIAIFAGAVLIYAQVVRPWLLAWGAKPAEAARTLPGDALLPEVPSSATRAITIDAPPEGVWPWIAQIGQGKGGFYSYAWLENLFGCRIANADEIHPEWQDVKIGDLVCLHPKMPGLPVTLVEQNRALVLGGDGIAERHIPPVTWAFVVEPAAHNSTRLLIRWRSRTPPTLYDLTFNKYLLEPIHFMMERKMMLGIRKRAEPRLAKSATSPAGRFGVS